MDQFMRQYLDARVSPLVELVESTGDAALIGRAREVAAQMEQIAEASRDGGDFEARFASCGLMDGYNALYADAYMAGGRSRYTAAAAVNATPAFTEEDVPAIRAEMAQEVMGGLAYELGDQIGFQMKQAVKDEIIYPARREFYEEAIHAPIIGDMIRAENDLWQIGEAAKLGRGLFRRKKKREDDSQ